MSAASLDHEPLRALRVAIVAADPKRRRALAMLVARAGHGTDSDAAESPERDADAADVVLADGALPATLKPVVSLGADDREQAAALPRDANLAQIDAALRAAAAGLTVRVVNTGGFAEAHEHAPAPLLTAREVTILTSIAAGLSNKAIARSLDISRHTVKFHVESLFRKLNARTRAEAVAKGLARRLAETVEL
jgi:DNA-binding NarL/FixJ family response regulator